MKTKQKPSKCAIWIDSESKGVFDELKIEYEAKLDVKLSDRQAFKLMMKDLSRGV
jgi:hypothetical protein